MLDRFQIVNEPPPAKPKVAPLSAMISCALESEMLSDKITQGHKDNARAIEVASSLEDMHLVLGGMAKVEDKQTALIQNAGALAVAGTGLDPSLGLAVVDNTTSQETQAALLKRVTDALNAYLFGVSNTFGDLSEFTRAKFVELKQAKATLDFDDTRFPLPDDPSDDIVRTVVVKPDDMLYFMTKDGVVPTFGDLINMVNKTVDGFTAVSKMNTLIVDRLLSVTRDVIPVSTVIDADDMSRKLVKASTELYNECRTIWMGPVRQSGLTEGRDDEDRTTMSTDYLLGGLRLGVAYRALWAKTNSEQLPFSHRSSSIQSFSAFATSVVGPQIEGQTLSLPGVTNAGIRKLIDKLINFLTDLERFASWISTTSEVAKTRCASDVANLDKYMNPEATGYMTPDDASQYRQCIQSHISDIESIVKLATDLSVLPLTKMMDMVHVLVCVIMKLDSETPEGNYNLPKPNSV